MEKMVDDQILYEKFKRIDEKLSMCESKDIEHAQKLDRLDRICAEDRVLINNLCKQIESLVSTIKWVGGPVIFGMIGFFFYAIQQSLLK